MRITNRNKIVLQVLKRCITKPPLYQSSTKKFWDDPYISAQMLKLHLNPKVDSASRTQATIEAEAAFIITETGMNKDLAVLDLGCGPGLYVGEFAKTGAKVTGLDLSECSISYAKEHITPKFSNTVFKQMNYLDLAFTASFNVATLIFYDFCVLSPDDQKALLQRINQALKMGGILAFDVITEHYPIQETTSITVSEGEGFWSPQPYIEIANTYRYEKPKTMGQQYTIISEDGNTEVTRLYTRLFNQTEIVDLLNQCGFEIMKIYKNLKGDALSEGSETFGVFAKKVRAENWG